MKQKQVLFYKSLKKQNHDFQDQITNHCYFNELAGQFNCKKCNCIVDINWPRKYAFCAIPGILWWHLRKILMTYSYGSWTLYKQNVALKYGRNQTIYFFTKWKPKRGTPCDLPGGYIVVVNERTGLPHLEKKANVDTRISLLNKNYHLCI